MSEIRFECIQDKNQSQIKLSQQNCSSQNHLEADENDKTDEALETIASSSALKKTICRVKKSVVTRCILHFGMPKTGSTAIQNFLTNHLTDKHFHFVYFRTPNSSKNIKIAFSEDLQNSPFRLRNNIPLKRLEKIRDEVLNCLDEQLCDAAQNGKSAIISGETLIGLSHNEMENLRSFILQRCETITPVIYIRTPKSLIESRFQQKLKGASVEAEDLDIARVYPEYQKRLQDFDRVFAPDQIQYWKYERNALHQQCVVQDFCYRLNIEWHQNDMISDNLALTLPAVSLLYIYRCHYTRFAERPLKIAPNHPLLKKLHELKGQKLRFHSSLIKPILTDNARDIAWMEARLEGSLSEDLYRQDADAVTNLEHLLTPDKQTLQWLMAELNRIVNNPTEHINSAQLEKDSWSSEQIADWVYQLYVSLTPEKTLRTQLRTALQSRRNQVQRWVDKHYSEFKHRKALGEFFLPKHSHQRKRIVKFREFGKTDDIQASYFLDMGFSKQRWKGRFQFPIIRLKDALIHNNTLFSEKYIYKGIINYPIASVGEVLKNQRQRQHYHFNPVQYFSFKYWDKKSGSAVMAREQIDKNLESPYFLLNSSVSTRNFAHFSFELLLQICYFDFIKTLNPRVKPLLGHPLKYPIMDYLIPRVFETDYQVLETHHLVQSKDLYVAKPISSFFAPDPYPAFTQDAINYLKQKLRQRFKPDPLKAKRKLFITRHDGVIDNKGLQRLYANQSELETILKRQGFEFITISEYSPEQIIELFSQARIILGVHGAGLTNMIFASEQARVIELCLPHRKSDKTPKCNMRFVEKWGLSHDRVPVVDKDLSRLDLDYLNRVLTELN